MRHSQPPSTSAWPSCRPHTSLPWTPCSLTTSKPLRACQLLPREVYLAFREQAGNDGPWSIKIRELATGKELAQIPTGDGRAPLTFSPDGQTLVWAPFRGGIVFSDVTTGKELRRLGDGSARHDVATNFAFSADGQLLAITR